MHAPEEARHVPKILFECGVKFVIVERLLHADIDGVCFWEKNTPIVGLSMRHDRIDNFWFVLRHEIEHVLLKHGQSTEMIDNLDGVRGLVSDQLPKEERMANSAAAEFCAPKLDNFLQRKQPHPSERDIIAFAHLNNRHPGLIVGQIRKRLDRYDYLTRHLAKIRQFIMPDAIVDGWGQTVPVDL